MFLSIRESPGPGFSVLTMYRYRGAAVTVPPPPLRSAAAAAAGRCAAAAVHNNITAASPGPAAEAANQIKE